MLFVFVVWGDSWLHIDGLKTEKHARTRVTGVQVQVLWCTGTGTQLQVQAQVQVQEVVVLLLYPPHTL